MLLKNAVGIDPDSEQIVCMFVESEGGKTEKKSYPVTVDGLEKFIGWVKQKDNIIIAIEGSNGQSKPIEKALRKQNIVFYSFKPIDVERKRQSQLLPGKNNEKDAYAAALLAMEYDRNNCLERWKRVYPVDEELQLLTRSHDKITRKISGEICDLWKTLHQASTDIYLFFGGKNEEFDSKANILNNAGILNLLCNCPELHKWKELKRNDFYIYMGGGNYKGREKIIDMIQAISGKISELPTGLMIMIRQSAEEILRLSKNKKELEKAIELLAESRSAIQTLAYNRDKSTGLKGIGVITASKIAAEIVHIGRFVKEDSLALYAGLGMIEDETGLKKPGRKKKLKHFHEYNRRLKNAVMTASKNFIHWNPDHRLAGMYIHFVKSGMSHLEAVKRVSRALIRIIFRLLKENYELELECKKNIESIKEENGVAKMGNKPGGKSPQATPPFSPVYYTQNHYNKITGNVNV
jgi:hypothetical protein